MSSIHSGVAMSMSYGGGGGGGSVQGLVQCKIAWYQFYIILFIYYWHTSSIIFTLYEQMHIWWELYLIWISLYSRCIGQALSVEILKVVFCHEMFFDTAAVNKIILQLDQLNCDFIMRWNGQWSPRLMLHAYSSPEQYDVFFMASYSYEYEFLYIIMNNTGIFYFT